MPGLLPSYNSLSALKTELRVLPYLPESDEWPSIYLENAVGYGFETILLLFLKNHYRQKSENSLYLYSQNLVVVKRLSRQF